MYSNSPVQQTVQIGEKNNEIVLKFINNDNGFIVFKISDVEFFNVLKKAPQNRSVLIKNFNIRNF